MKLFYAPELLIDQKTYILDENEAMHCIKVMRLSTGDMIHLTNGKGIISEAVIEYYDRKSCCVSVQKTKVAHNKFPIVEIAIAPTKNHDRLEWVVEKSAELGISSVIPLICHNSERKKINKDRLERLAISAMKQSLNIFLPEIKGETNFNEYIGQHFDGIKLIAVCNHENCTTLNSSYRKGENVRILIGPEGDFSHEELGESLQNGYIPITLGENRLRTETAAIAISSFINQINL